MCPSITNANLTLIAASTLFSEPLATCNSPFARTLRLKQIGLLPELVIVAGFASLIVACVGLCGLNYSSHHTLNVYGKFISIWIAAPTLPTHSKDRSLNKRTNLSIYPGFLCVVFTLMLVLGIPEVWYKSEQFVEGNLLINIVYFTLLFILLVLLLFAFTFSHHLRQEEQLALSPYQQQDTSCSLPNCTCNLNANDEPELGAGGSILDRWFPSANNKHNRLDSLNSPSRNNNNNLGCHLSDLRMPLYVNNLYNNDDCFDSSSSRVNMSNAAASSFSTANLNCNDRAAILNQCAPLIHKGFYKTDPPKSKTYTKTLNNQSGDSQQRQLKIISSGTNWTAPRVQRFASSQCIATKDDNSLQYGSLDSVLMPPDQPRLSQSATMNSRCRCNLEDFSKLQNNADSRVLAYRNKYPLANQLPPSTMPILNSRSSYALTRSGPKIRAKGSSSGKLLELRA